jgi:hypothetical protein
MNKTIAAAVRLSGRSCCWASPDLVFVVIQGDVESPAELFNRAGDQHGATCGMSFKNLQALPGNEGRDLVDIRLVSAELPREFFARQAPAL